MKALIWTDNKKLELREVEEPNLKRPDDVKVKIYGTGICGTDLHIIGGKMEGPTNMIIGHEAIGKVVEVGDEVKHIKVGDEVIIDPTQYCGNCYYCNIGLTCYCTDFSTYQVGIGTHGTFAEYYVGQESYIYKIPENMSRETAWMVEPLCCVLNVFEKLNVRPDQSVLVLGSGPIGLICQLMSSKVARLTVSTEVNAYRKKMSEKYVDYCYDPQELTVEEVHRINRGRGFDVIIDAVGDKLHTAMDYVGKNTKMVPMGFNNTYEITLKTIDLLTNGTSIIGTGEVHQLMEKAIDIALNLSELGELVTKKVPMEQYKEAFDELLNKKGDSQDMKIILTSPGM